MDMMNTENNIATGKLPFPSTVKTPCPNADVQALSREIVDTSRDMNNILASAGNVHNYVRAHYVDTAMGTYGIESLISAILKERGAIFPAGIEGKMDENGTVINGEFRNVAIAASMFATEVIAAVRDTFGADRYPDPTIRSYLSHFMTKSGKVGNICLKSAEDCGRPCDKPRTKFYLVEGK